MIKFKFRRRSTASVTEERIIGILSAALPTSRIAIREYNESTYELFIDDSIFSVYAPNAFTNGQWTIAEDMLMVARSSSLFRAVMLIANSLN